MLNQCIAVKTTETPSDVVKSEPAGRRGLSEEYLNVKRYDIVTKNGPDGLTPAGDPDSNRQQIRGLPVGRRIAADGNGCGRSNVPLWAVPLGAIVESKFSRCEKT